MISVLQQLADEAFEDEYLKELLHKLEENFCSNFYKSPYQANLTDLEINHLLRFSDILCRSKNSLHRNLSLKIISLLLEINEIKNLDYFYRN